MDRQTDGQLRANTRQKEFAKVKRSSLPMQSLNRVPVLDPAKVSLSETKIVLSFISTFRLQVELIRLEK
jgi:hypothetical protein